jgi:hypothetical protein
MGKTSKTFQTRAERKRPLARIDQAKEMTVKLEKVLAFLTGTETLFSIFKNEALPVLQRNMLRGDGV